MATDDFTYPELDQEYADSYLYHLIAYIKDKKEDKIVKMLQNSECRITTTTSFSRSRWNAYEMKVHFSVPLDKFISLDGKESIKFKAYCNDIVDKSYGYDVTEAKIVPVARIDTCSEEKMTREISHIQERVQETLSRNILPKDMLDKGREMTHVYLYIYCVENSLRLFIEDVGAKKLGRDYFNKLKIKNETRKKITSRKEDEAHKKWTSLRGDSDIFYTDFSELGNIFENNWEIFKEYFPSIAWIKTKIDELAECRIRIAHNSYISQDEQESIRASYKNILKQLGALER
ncbi:MAG: hypothetical protein JW999_08620 [Methanotrichaceae archaeon]|nr:hypothetical protein [Methanotrichaceae archaeon]